MKQLFKDYRSTVISVFALVVVIISAIYSSMRLENISLRINSAITREKNSSSLVKSMLTELRVAENNVKAYNLTTDTQFLNDYIISLNTIKDLCAILNTGDYRKSTESALVDSVIIENIRCLSAIKMQIKIKNNTQLIKVLDRLGAKLEHIQNSTPTSDPTTLVAQSDDKKKMKWSLKNLFKSQPKEKIDAPVTTQQSIVKAKTATNSVKNVISTAKKEQEAILANAQEREFMLVQKAFQARSKLVSYYSIMQEKEIAREANKVALAGFELKSLKVSSILATMAISLLLLILSLVSLFYVRKRKQYEQMLLTSKQEAERLARTRESFLANMSHEIKTPLNAIHGFSQVLLDGKLDDEQRKQVLIMRDSSAFLTRIVNNILSYAKLESGIAALSETNVNLKNELDNLYELLRPEAAKRNNTLIVDHADLQIATHFVDNDKLKQILLNLLGNALKFTENGTVTLKATQVTTKEGFELKFIVSDTGIGIRKEILTKLFTEFEQGDAEIQAKFGGNGLGLHLSKKLAEMMGGSITITSSFGKGTTVSFCLPLVKDKELTKVKDHTPENKIDLSSKTILIADDDNYNRALLSSILKKNGARVLEAVNGYAAINLCFIEKPDLIIMDVRMPELNGIDATMQIRGRGCGVPIIGATAVASQEKINRCMKAGMNSLLFKPFLIAELNEKLSHELALKVLTKEISEIPKVESVINLQHLNSATEGDPALRTELIDLFVKNLKEIKSTLRTLISNKNYDHAYELAHRTIPSCKHFDAKQLISTLNFFEELKNTTYINTKKLFDMCTEVETNIDLVLLQLKASEKIHETE